MPLFPVKPYFLSDPVDVTAREGEDISLECEVGGDPSPVFTWTRESGEVTIVMMMMIVITYDNAR